MTETSFDQLTRAVFTPRSVALVGLSSNPATAAGRPLGYMRQNGFAGAIRIVNPARGEVQGEPAFPSLADLPEVPDHAYILVNHARVEQAVIDCAEAGVPVATVLADGYAESGAEGRAAQERLVAIGRETGLRLLGPNSMGVADLHTGGLITVNAIYREPDPLRGRASLISQSGSMMGGLISRAAALGIGFSRVAAVGNEADLGTAELGRMMLADRNTDVILLFVETIRDPDGLAGLAAAAHRAGKPIVAFKLGRSTLGQQMAVAHTGALLAEDAVTDAFLREIGIARVTTLEALTEAAAFFAGRTPPEHPPRVGLFTTTGGGGAMVADRLALEGVTIQPTAQATLDAVRATGLNVSTGPVLDLGLAGAGPDYVKPAVEAMARDPDVDIILSVTGSSGRSAPDRTVAPLVEADLQGKPLAGFITPEATGTLRQMVEAGIPAFRTPESCGDVIGAFARWRAPRVASIARVPVDAPATVLDEAASLDILRRAGVPVVNSIALGIGEVPDAPLNYPVAVKVLSDAVPHKSDAGGVVLGVPSPAGVAEASRRIKASVEARHPGVTIERVLVAPMVAPLQEVLIGYRLDASVGPVVTLAPGGILVGLYDDKAIRIAPVDEATAREMIGEVAGLAPIRGHRGLPVGDLDGLARAIAALSRLAHDEKTILEAEANPVMVTQTSVVAADALVTLAEGKNA